MQGGEVEAGNVEEHTMDNSGKKSNKYVITIRKTKKALGLMTTQ